MNRLLKNVGPTDRIIRIGLSALLAGVGLYFKDLSITFAIGLAVISLVLLITALISSCPLYLPFGISTRRIKKWRQQQ